MQVHLAVVVKHVTPQTHGRYSYTRENENQTWQRLIDVNKTTTVADEHNKSVCLPSKKTTQFDPSQTILLLFNNGGKS